MTVAVGDILKFVAKGTLGDGSEWNWVFHQLVTAGSTESDLVVLQALRDHLDLACVGIETLLTNTFDSTEVELYVYDSVLHQFDGTAQAGWTTFNGTSATDALANSAALLVKFFTNKGRRQGRKYIAGYTEGNRTYNSWVSATLATALAWSALLDDALITGSVTCTPCVFNTSVGSTLYETTELFNGVTAVDTFSSTQRRRKPGVGI